MGVLNLVEKVRQQAFEQPEKTAYYFLGKGTSYGELEQSVARFAAALEDLGVKRRPYRIFIREYTALHHQFICINAYWCCGNSD